MGRNLLKAVASCNRGRELSAAAKSHVRQRLGGWQPGHVLQGRGQARAGENPWCTTYALPIPEQDAEPAQIDYSRVMSVKLPVIETLHRHFLANHAAAADERGRAFRNHVQEAGADLRRFAIFDAGSLTELQHGWKTDSPGVAPRGLLREHRARRLASCASTVEKTPGQSPSLWWPPPSSGLGQECLGGRPLWSATLSSS